MFDPLLSVKMSTSTLLFVVFEQISDTGTEERYCVRAAKSLILAVTVSNATVILGSRVSEILLVANFDNSGKDKGLRNRHKVL